MSGDETRPNETPPPCLMHVFTVASSLIFLKGQARYMQEAGFDVVAVSSPGPEQARLADSDNLRTISLGMERRITPFKDLLTLGTLIALMRRERPAIVDAHTPKAGLLGMIAARLAGVSCRIYHMRGLPVETATGARRLLLRLTERVACLLADRVVVESPSLKEAALRWGISNRSKLTVLGERGGIGVDSHGEYAPQPDDASRRAATRGRLGIAANAPVAGFVGRLARDKGIRELAQAWKELSAEPDGACLIIAGAPEPNDALADQAMTSLLQLPRVHYVGHQEDVRALYPAFDMLVLPTYREGMGAVLVEAGALALPVVATSVTGCIDVVLDGETGTLVPPRDASALAAAMRGYIRSPEVAATHGHAARERVIHLFDRDALSAELAGLYSGLLQSKKRSGWRGKRLMDLALVIATAPIWIVLSAIVAVLVRWRMGSPVLIRQSRSGLRERPFSLVKFRTMTDARDDGGALLPDEERITPFGKWLRSTSLDELPQLWNVLLGEMSLVGPRPLPTMYLPLYSKRHRRRHDVRPGITGLAQVRGRNGLTWCAKFDFDVEYVQRSSPVLDARILWQTIRVIFGRRGIVSPGTASAPEFRGYGEATAPPARGDGRSR